MCYRSVVFVVLFALVALTSLLAAEGAFCLTSQNVPAAEMPVANASPGIPSSPTPGATPSQPENYEPQQPASVPTPQDYTDGTKSLTNDSDSTNLETGQGDDSVEPQPAAEATVPPPALDADTLTVGPELGNESLDPEIAKAVAPAMVASLRLTESARKHLVDGQVNDAMRDLAGAISLDSADAFAYYYLGRAYLAKKDYMEALTFFRRAEIGFNGRADWTAEALSYEGICEEELGKDTDAMQAYKRALAASPNNFRARIGYGRLANIASPMENVDAPPPDQDLAIPPPEAPDGPASSDQPPP
jgi:TolA-binding protein